MFEEYLLRVYLLSGLVAHKAVWEIMKRRQSSYNTSPGDAAAQRLNLVKTAKIVILLGILAQTVLPPILPIVGAPLSFRAAGVLSFTLGLAVAILGRLQLGGNWSDIEQAGVLKDQAVVSVGIYRFIRHPIYVGDLFLLVGLELALNSWLVVGALALIPLVLRQAVREELMLARTLPGYPAYCSRTKRFLPFVV